MGGEGIKVAWIVEVEVMVKETFSATMTMIY
jgi:hypothetical protein